MCGWFGNTFSGWLGSTAGGVGLIAAMLMVAGSHQLPELNVIDGKVQPVGTGV